MNIPEFKIRCSSIAQIMGGSLDLTEKQEARYNELSFRNEQALNGVEGVKPLTANMKAELEQLAAEREKPDIDKITQGMKTFCKSWLNGKMFDFEKNISGRALEKGNRCEFAAVDLVGKVYVRECLKNEENYQNDFLTGTPDIILPSEIIDTKCSQDPDSFPLHETELPTKGYFYQVQGYMDLTGKKFGSVVYCLLDYPEDMLASIAKSECYKNGLMFDSPEGEEVFEDVKKNLTFSHVDAKYRVKRFDFEYCPDTIAEIKRRVKVCREYIEILKAELGL